MITRLQRFRESTAVGLMLCGLFVSMTSWPLYVAHVVGVA